VPASLPSDHMTMLGWFLSRSTVRRMRSRYASRQAGSSLGLPVQPTASKPWVSRSHSRTTQKPSSSARSSRRGVRRVVAGADRVDVEALHTGQVGAGVLLVEDPAPLGVGLVAVHPAEDDPAAVDEEPVAADLHAAEADPHRDGLGSARDRRLVQPRPLGGPGPHRGRRQRRHVRGTRPHLLDAEFRDAQGDGECLRARGDLGVDPPVPVLVAGAQPDVLDAAGGAGVQGDVAEDARQPPLVLVLDVAGRRPLVHPHRDDVVTRPDGRGDVELVGQPAAARVADLLAVDPDPEQRLHPVEAQHDPLGVLPAAGQVEVAAVVAGRVLVTVLRKSSAGATAPACCQPPAEGRTASRFSLRRPRSWAPGAGISPAAGSSRQGWMLTLMEPMARSRVIASSVPPPTTSYSALWSSSTVAGPAATNWLAGKVGTGCSPQPPSAVSPRGVTANCPAEAEPVTGSGTSRTSRPLS
jgi:hypothetical protein